jgi:hypothetical protein
MKLALSLISALAASACEPSGVCASAPTSVALRRHAHSVVAECEVTHNDEKLSRCKDGY